MHTHDGRGAHVEVRGNLQESVFSYHIDTGTQNSGSQAWQQISLHPQAYFFLFYRVRIWHRLACPGLGAERRPPPCPAGSGFPVPVDPQWLVLMEGHSGSSLKTSWEDFLEEVGFRDTSEGWRERMKSSRQDEEL